MLSPVADMRRKLGPFLYERPPPGYDPRLRDKRPRQVFPNGVSYEGEWLNGLRDGQGIQVWQDGSLYEGYFKND